VRKTTCIAILLTLVAGALSAAGAAEYRVTESEDLLTIVTPQLEAAVRTRGYTSGVAAGSLLDKKTGFRDAGFGLDIVDWIMEPGTDTAYRDKLEPGLAYHFGDLVHGQRAKRSIEGPQICTQAKALEPAVVRGEGFVAVRQSFQYRTAAPGRRVGSVWTQWLVFPVGKRYFISMDRIDAVNSSEGMFLRVDMPGHIRHQRGDTFSEIYLSYHGQIPANEFFEDFAPDARFHYLRGRGEVPERLIRAYRLRDPKTGGEGPWLAGMTLDPSVVYEAWCHQRGYVCMIEEFGGFPVKAGESLSAAFIVGYFDSIEEMNEVYDRHKGNRGLVVSPKGWKLVEKAPDAETVLDPAFGVKKVAEGCKFTEGPAVDAHGTLFFSDGPNDRIMRLSKDGKLAVFRQPCGRANGLMFDQEGRLVWCQSAGEGGGRAVVRLEKDGSLTTLADQFEGKPFIAPNDLAIDRRGRIFFTDPYFRGERSQPASGVYRIDGPGKVAMVISNLLKPNGILVTADGRYLYVSDRGTQQLRRYRLTDDGGIAADGFIYDFSPDRGIDGMWLDVHGNIYGAAGLGETTGLFVINPAGRLLAHQPLPEMATNVTFGGPDMQTIYVTAGGNVYAMRGLIPGARLPDAPRH